MIDVPRLSVTRCVESGMHRVGRFDGAERDNQMKASDGHSVDDFRTQFVHVLARLLDSETAETLDAIQ